MALLKPIYMCPGYCVGPVDPLKVEEWLNHRSIPSFRAPSVPEGWLKFLLECISLFCSHDVFVYCRF